MSRSRLVPFHGGAVPFGTRRENRDDEAPTFPDGIKACRPTHCCPPAQVIKAAQRYQYRRRQAGRQWEIVPDHRAAGALASRAPDCRRPHPRIECKTIAGLPVCSGQLSGSRPGQARYEKLVPAYLCGHAYVCGLSNDLPSSCIKLVIKRIKSASNGITLLLLRIKSLVTHQGRVYVRR